MPTGILDIGSNTVHLIVLHPAPHARPTAIAQQRWVVPLMQYLDGDDALVPDGVQALSAAVDQALAFAEEQGVDQLVGMATSAFREIANGREVLRELERRANTDIQVLTGSDESEFTFVAARRWAGWGSGRLLVCDIGGSSLQIAQGGDEIPDQAFSLPLGAGRLTHQFLPDQPASAGQVAALRDHIQAVLATISDSFGAHSPDLTLGTSKLLRSLGQLAGSPVRGGADERTRVVSLAAIDDWAERLGRMSLEARAELPGMTPERALMMHAAALVASETLRQLGVSEFQTCPWALREGVLLQHSDQMSGSSSDY